MELEKLLMIGAGGQGKVVIDAIRAAKIPFQIIIADEDKGKNGHVISGQRIIAPVTDALLVGAMAFHVAVGHNASRERITSELEKCGIANTAIVHFRACVSETAQILCGVFVAAHAVIAPDARLERGCIVNHGAIIDHDCVVGEFSHIAPNVTLGGGVKVGRRVLIGAGANILPGVSINDDCVVGAGAVVLNDLGTGTVHVGVPARKTDK
ncbi:MAG: hypothetical protein A3I66_20155 [Burkholderiales bacterium RIFCSPLOWO2_02_FULL_57_36]|nr:MAG: hypothetical protein A3I66_20155 [Burkholderiales bacterium RIFCSPLOWO2_02_FULL_57_36]